MGRLSACGLWFRGPNTLHFGGGSGYHQTGRPQGDAKARKEYSAKETRLEAPMSEFIQPATPKSMAKVPLRLQNLLPIRKEKGHSNTSKHTGEGNSVSLVRGTNTKCLRESWQAIVGQGVAACSDTSTLNS